MRQPKNPHRDKELDKYIGKVVEITLTGDPTRKYTGVLAFVDEFSKKYGYNLPGHYVLRGKDRDVTFRKSYVRTIRRA